MKITTQAFATDALTVFAGRKRLGIARQTSRDNVEAIGRNGDHLGTFHGLNRAIEALVEAAR